jgi:hypothetical protein
MEGYSAGGALENSIPVSATRFFLVKGWLFVGGLVRDELQDIEVSSNQLCRALRAPIHRISAIANGKRAISVDTAMRPAATNY